MPRLTDTTTRAGLTAMQTKEAQVIYEIVKGNRVKGGPKQYGFCPETQEIPHGRVPRYIIDPNGNRSAI